MAPLKLASGCDRRCSFCAIPTLPRVVRLPPARRRARRGRAGWPEQGVRELFLVSENSTSYGKDLGDLRLLETLLPELAAVDGIERVRVSLPAARGDPARAWCRRSPTPPGVADYFDLSFQHASAAVLRRMRRFGDPDVVPGAARPVRARSPGGRGPLQRDRRLPRRDRGGPRRRCATSWRQARLDAVGVFGYSDEDGTEAEGFDGKLDDDEIAARVEHVTRLVEELTAQRAEDRIGDDRCQSWSSRRTAPPRRPAASRAGPSTRAPRSTASPRWSATSRRPGR